MLATGLTRRARAIGPGSALRIGQLLLPGVAQEVRAGGLRRALWEIDKRTSINVARDPVPLRLSDETLWETPFLYLSGDRAFPSPSTREIERLRRFLGLGGFLLVDSAEGRVGGSFDAAVRRLLADVFPPPAAGLTPLAEDHVLWKSFYLVDRGAGRLLLAPLEAIQHDKRLVAVYCQNDLVGAFERDALGSWEHPCIPGGEAQRETAFRLAINVAMYALCLDYKADQVHVPFILKRRQWRPAP